MIYLVYQINKTIGSGHFMRCESIQKEFASDYNFESKLISIDEYYNWEAEEKRIIIVDVFSIELATEFIGKTQANNLVVTLDYFSNNSSPDLNISVLEQFTGKRTHKNFVGLEYAVIRPDVVKHEILLEKQNEVFVYIGGDGSSSFVNRIANQFCNSSYTFNLVRNQNSEMIAGLPDNFNQFQMPSNVLELMNRAKFAIVSPGLAIMELLYFGVPSILCPLNSLHNRFSEFLITNQLAISNFEDFSIEKLDDINAIQAKAKEKVNKHGISRIIRVILNAYEQKMDYGYSMRF